MQTRSRNVSLVLFDEVELWDVAALCCALSEAGRKWNWRPFRVHCVAAKPGPVRTRSQLSVLADSSFEAAPQPDVLLVPGGFGARRAARDPQVVEFCRNAAPQAETWGAVGAGIGLLGRAGLVQQRQIASNAALAAWLAESCPEARTLSSDGVCECGTLLSVASSAGAPALALALVERLLGARFAADVAAVLTQSTQAAGTSDTSAERSRLTLDRVKSSPLEGSPVAVQDARWRWTTSREAHPPPPKSVTPRGTMNPSFHTFALISPNPLLRAAYGRLFRQIQVDPSWGERVRRLAEQGSIVYVLRSMNVVDFLALDYFTRELGLPAIRSPTSWGPGYLRHWRATGSALAAPVRASA